MPQWNSNGTPASPRIYRGLYQAGYAGLQAAGLRTPKVLFGETAPTGFDTVNRKREGSRALLHDVAPLAFLREALCLNARYQRAGSCGEAADERLRPPRLHEGRQPALGQPETRRRHDRLALAAVRRARPRRAAPARSRRTCRST